jgi:hypothetical protein
MAKVFAQRLISFAMALALVLGIEVYCTPVVADTTAVVIAASLDSDGCTDCAPCKGSISECVIQCSTVAAVIENLNQSFGLCGFVAFLSTKEQFQSHSLAPDTAPPRS